mgnify:CR=1 FL=1
MIKNIMIVGVGGQGSLLASKILGKAAMDAGYDVKVSEVHGMSQRGGSVVTYVRYGDEPVYSPVIGAGEADVILSFELLESARWLPCLKIGGTVVTSLQQINPMPVIMGVKEYPENILAILEKEHKVCTVDGQAIALELKNAKVLNSVVLGFAAKHVGFEKEAWLDVIEKTVPAKTIEINKNAFTMGYEA